MGVLGQAGPPKCPKVSCQVGQEYNYYLLLFGLPQALMRQINITAPDQPSLIF